MSDLFTFREVDYMETARNRLTFAIREAKLGTKGNTAHCDLNAIVHMLCYVEELEE